MRRQLAVLATLFALALPSLSACGVSEKGKIDGLPTFNSDRTACTFVGHKTYLSEGKKHQLPSNEHPQTYDNSVCRSGTPIEYILYSDGALEVTYSVKYQVGKTPDGDGCNITYTPLDTGWPPDKQKVHKRLSCTGYTTGTIVHRKHTAPQEGTYVA